MELQYLSKFQAAISRFHPSAELTFESYRYKIQRIEI